MAAMAQSAKQGVTVAVAPQLFPTPAALAARMVELAGVRPGDEVLEPSAGTGVICDAIIAAGGKPFAIEIDHRLAEGLARRWPDGSGICTNVLQADFLECFADMLGKFDAIIMNPPFVNASDVKHILHARSLLKPGGVLVAICANGPRQGVALQDLSDYWEELPSGTFAGTGVRAVLMVIRA